MDAAWGRIDRGNEWNAAVDLANRVATGIDLPRLAGSVLLDSGETLHADVTAEGWRFEGVNVAFEAPRVVAFGGPLMFGLVAVGSAAARRRARREAEALATPQWRSLGLLRVLVSDRRLLVWHEGAWASVWFHAIREFGPDLEAARLLMTFDEDPPYCLGGRWVPFLTVVVTTILARDRGVTATSDAVGVTVNR